MKRSTMGRIGLALLAPLLLTGCLLSPGKFASELAVMKDGNFSFRYTGEIQMLALGKLAGMAAGKDDEFEPEQCFDDDFETRGCSADEIAKQRSAWEEGSEARAASKAREVAQMKALLGGIDPSNPDAARELAARLERQRGWKSVRYLDGGLFEVEFSISGRLGHDFQFPTVEGMPGVTPFVAVHLREGDQVRVNAPGFASSDQPNPLLGGAPLAALAALSKDVEGEELPNIAVPEGVFRIVTDGRILANNTNEGAAAHATGQVLEWSISPRTKNAPTALIAF
ncbi:MAG: hypothetical protein ACR2FJ_04095 [Qipengyuania sp.]